MDSKATPRTLFSVVHDCVDVGPVTLILCDLTNEGHSDRVVIPDRTCNVNDRSSPLDLLQSKWS